ncbi:hypothetical protein [Paraburkholderia sp. JHI869]|uniref:hypothetical protein n=1 Tax=Paraburkholderia sp. JHI869 TaxID=3112959 RepID=UPI003176F820
MKAIGWLMLAAAAAVIMVITACGVKVESPDGAQQLPESVIHADDVVTMSKSSFGCEFESNFSEALDHYLHKEFSAWAQITGESPWCFNGASLAKNQTWTVLQVRNNVMQIAQTTLHQYEADPSRYDHSYWTAVHWATKVNG